MGNINAGLYISLDGVIESGWTGHTPALSPTDPLTSTYFNDAEVGRAVAAMMEPNEAMLMGRVTYEGLAVFFGPQTGDYADRVNAMPKYVVSDSLGAAEWVNTTVLRGRGLARQVAGLKDRFHGPIGVGGSATLVRWLLAERLLDRLDLLMFPLILGSGARLYADGQPPAELRLLESRALTNGVLHLSYAAYQR